MTSTIISPLDYPALTGSVVTEAHAALCRDKGHATHTVDGKASPICPRCGGTRTAIKPLTPLMAAMLINVADKGEAMAKGRDLITLRGLESRGLVEITNTTRDIHSDRSMRTSVLFYTTTDAGYAKAVELV